MLFYNALDLNNQKILCLPSIFQFDRKLGFWTTLQLTFQKKQFWHKKIQETQVNNFCSCNECYSTKVIKSCIYWCLVSFSLDRLVTEKQIQNFSQSFLLSLQSQNLKKEAVLFSFRIKTPTGQCFVFIIWFLVTSRANRIEHWLSNL